MSDASICPLMDALTERHSHLRKAEKHGQRLAQETADLLAAGEAHTRMILDALRANPMIRVPRPPAEPKPFDRAAFANAFNNPLGEWSRKYGDHG